jgi:hypothetical protein
VELAYARVSTSKQDLERHLDAPGKQGIPPPRIYVDKNSGATTDRPGLRALLDYARGGDVIVVHTLDRLGRTVRDTLNLIHELSERGVGVRNLADPIRIDSTDPGGPMAQLAVVLLALFAQMERTYASSVPRTPARWPRPRAAAPGGRSAWTRTSWPGRRTCATPSRPGRRPRRHPSRAGHAAGTRQQPAGSARFRFRGGRPPGVSGRDKHCTTMYVDVPAETGVRLGAGRAARCWSLGDAPR